MKLELYMKWAVDGGRGSCASLVLLLLIKQQRNISNFLHSKEKTTL